MAENQTRGVSPLSDGASVPRADCRADAALTSTMNNYDNDANDGFGRIDTEQTAATEVAA